MSQVGKELKYGGNAYYFFQFMMKYSKGKVACSERVEYLFHPIDLATRIWECLQAVLHHGLMRRQSISLLHQYGNCGDQLYLFYDY